MSRQKIILTGLILLLPLGFLHAQRWLEMWVDERDQHSFQEIQAEFNRYFEDHEMVRGTGYKQYKRWEYYMEARVGDDGSIQNPYAETWKNYRNYVENRAIESGRTASTNGNWTFFGSQDHFRGNSGYNGGIGRINVIRFHPTNSNIIYAGAPAGGLWRSNNGGTTWAPLTDGIAFWGVSGIVIHPTNPNTIFILTGDGDGSSSRSAGVWKSTNGGVTWTPTGLNWDYTTTNIGGYKLLMDPSNSNVMYAVTTSGLYKTTNAGVSWTVVKTGSYRDMEFKPGNSNTLYLSSTNAVHRSLDAGATWTQVHTVAGANRIALGVSPANGNYVYAVAGPNVGTGSFRGLYRSANSGATWSTMSTTPNILGYSQTGNDASSQSWYDLAIAVSPTNINEIHVGGINMWKSVNGGSTWSNTSYWREDLAGAGNYTHADIHEVVYNGSTLYCGSDGGVYRSTDGANNWTDLSSGLAITEFYRFGGTPQNSNLFVGGAQDNGSNIVEAPIPDLVMEHIYGADGMEAAIDYTNQNTMYFTTQGGGLRRSTNGGNTSTSIKPTNLGSGNWVTPFVLHPTNASTILAGYTDVGVSVNQGTSWTDLSNGAIGGGACNMVAYAPSNANYIYAVKSSAVWKSVNGGSTWTNITAGLPGGTYTYIAVNPTNPNHIYVTRSTFTANSKVFMSTNGGSTWTNYSGTALPNVPANCIAYEPGSPNGVYIGTDAGVYYRDDNQTDWIDFSNGLPFLRVMELEINTNVGRLRAATYGRSMWESDLYTSIPCPTNLVLTGTVTGTEVNAASNTIASTQTITSTADVTYSAGTSITLNPGFSVALGGLFLAKMDGCNARAPREFVPVTGTYVPPADKAGESQFATTEGYEVGNYPNPFRSHTWIAFRTPRETRVSLEVYNIQGEMVGVVLRDDLRHAGSHTVSFDGSDLAPGQYFLKYTAGEQVSTHKMLVVR